MHDIQSALRAASRIVELARSGIPFALHDDNDSEVVLARQERAHAFPSRRVCRREDDAASRSKEAFDPWIGKHHGCWHLTVLRPRREDLREARREIRERTGDVDGVAPCADGSARSFELPRDPAPGTRRCNGDCHADEW
jgi:hypothetical protein